MTSRNNKTRQIFLSVKVRSTPFTVKKEELNLWRKQLMGLLQPCWQYHQNLCQVNYVVIYALPSRSWMALNINISHKKYYNATSLGNRVWIIAMPCFPDHGWCKWTSYHKKLTRALDGGRICLHIFFSGYKKTSAHSSDDFDTPAYNSIIHLACKFWHPEPKY